ncbi:MAG: hypothetical protein J0G95_04250 [Rhizobiales bacterium]|nr:hypothetical protein [Hyphomicrobiales bacterium]
MMDATKLRHILFHTLCAAVFIFVLNFYVLGTGIESSLSWAVAFGAMAAVLAYQQTRR